MTQSMDSGQASESGAGADRRKLAKFPLLGSQSALPALSNNWYTDADSKGEGGTIDPRPVGLKFLTWKRVWHIRQGHAGA